MKTRAILAGTLGVALALPACVPEAVGPLQPSVPELDESPTFTILASVTANGYWRRSEDYQWTVTKTASAGALPILQGETRTIAYGIEVLRTVQVVDDFGSKGKVCISTYYGVPESLNITGFVQYYDPQINDGNGDWVVIPGIAAVVDHNGNNEGVDEYGGTITCYKYKVSMTSEPHQTVDWLGYKFLSLIFIGNLWNGDEYLQGRANFNFPAEPEIDLGQPTATLNDRFVCPSGFTCGSLPPELQSPIGLGGSASYAYSLDVTNQGAACDAHLLRNLATLTIDNDGGGSDARADTWLENACDGIDPTIWACNAGFWRTQDSFAYWVNHEPAEPVGNVFPPASAYRDRNDKVLSSNWLVEALHRQSGKGKEALDDAAIDLLREGTARVLNLEYQGGNAPAIIAQINATLASGDRIAMLDLAGQLRGQNFTGTCRLL